MEKQVNRIESKVSSDKMSQTASFNNFTRLHNYILFKENVNMIYFAKLIDEKKIIIRGKSLLKELVYSLNFLLTAIFIQSHREIEELLQMNTIYLPDRLV